jgi:hypothetical protein
MKVWDKAAASPLAHGRRLVVNLRVAGYAASEAARSRVPPAIEESK